MKNTFIQNLESLCPDEKKGAIAKSMHMSYEALRSWCVGKNEPSFKKLLKLIEIFNVSPTWLIFGKGPKDLNSFNSDLLYCDMEILIGVIEGLEETLFEKGYKNIPPKKKAKAISILYKSAYKNKGNIDPEVYDIVLEIINN